MIRGGAFYVQATLEKTPHMRGLRTLFGTHGFCQMLESNQPIGTHDLQTEDKVFLKRIQIEKNTLRFWLIQDPLQTGFIQNAVQILTRLIK